jgi:hypothetical protein
LAWGNGFRQILDVYRIRNESELVFLKRFDAGEEGVAKLFPDGRILVIRSQPKGHHLEQWGYKEGTFQMSSGPDIPNLLVSNAWRDYFLES